MLQPLAPRDGVTREIHGVSVATNKHFHHRRVEKIGGVSDVRSEGSRFGRRGGGEGGDERLKRFWFDERLITLHVDHEIAGFAADGLRDPIGAGDMVCRGQNRPAAGGANGGADALVIGRHKNVRRATHQRATTPDANHHWLAADISERLARQARRPDPCRDGDDDFHNDG